MIVAKSIAAGLPLSGVIGKAELMDAPHTRCHRRDVHRQPGRARGGARRPRRVRRGGARRRAAQHDRGHDPRRHATPGRRAGPGSATCAASARCSRSSSCTTPPRRSLRPSSHAAVIDAALERGLILLKAGTPGTASGCSCPLTIEEPCSTRRSPPGRTRSPRPRRVDASTRGSAVARDARARARRAGRAARGRNAALGEELRIDARRREAGNRVELVDDDLAVRAHEEVDARHAFAVGRDERLDREPLTRSASRREPGGHDQIHAAVRVLRLEVVPVRVRRRSRRPRRRSGRGSRALPPRPPCRAGTPRPEPCRRAGGRARRVLELASTLRPSRSRPMSRAEPASRTPGSRTGSRQGRPAVSVMFGRHRDARVAQDGLEQVLVHAQRRRGDAGAHVRARRRARAGPVPCRPRRTGRAGSGSTTSTAPSAAGAAAVGIGQRRPARRAAAHGEPSRAGAAQAPSRPISIVCVS